MSKKPKKVSLTQKKQLDSWSVLIDDAQGRAKEIFETVKRVLEESEAPGIKSEMIRVPTYRTTGGLFGKTVMEDYLRVTNENLKDFRMYIGARDYGKALIVSWYLTCEPGPFKQLFSSLVEKNPLAFSFSMDVVKSEELSAYVTRVHHSVLEAVDTVMRSLGQDPSKINRKSKGFLGVS